MTALGFLSFIMSTSWVSWLSISYNMCAANVEWGVVGASHRVHIFKNGTNATRVRLDWRTQRARNVIKRLGHYQISKSMCKLMRAHVTHMGPWLGARPWPRQFFRKRTRRVAPHSTALSVRSLPFLYIKKVHQPRSWIFPLLSWRSRSWAGGEFYSTRIKPSWNLLSGN